MHARRIINDFTPGQGAHLGRVFRPDCCGAQPEAGNVDEHIQDPAAVLIA
jgi:hypothetical protein